MQRTTASWSDAAGDRAYIEWSSAADNRFGTYLHVYFCARVCRASGQPLDSHICIYIYIYIERERERERERESDRASASEHRPWPRPTAKTAAYFNGEPLVQAYGWREWQRATASSDVAAVRLQASCNTQVLQRTTAPTTITMQRTTARHEICAYRRAARSVAYRGLPQGRACGDLRCFQTCIWRPVQKIENPCQN